MVASGDNIILFFSKSPIPVSDLVSPVYFEISFISSSSVAFETFCGIRLKCRKSIKRSQAPYTKFTIFFLFDPV